MRDVKVLDMVILDNVLKLNSTRDSNQQILVFTLRIVPIIIKVD